MVDTKKLYDEFPYEKSFTATVLSCEEIKNKKEKVTGYAVVLDQTLFFPKEGGQSCDRGILGGFEVSDVQIRKAVITHVVAGALEVGSVVSGKIDWDFRFSNMQNHTGEHILSGLIHRKYGYNNVGFHLSESEVTMDMDGVVSSEALAEIEREANGAVWANIPVSCTYPSKDVLKDLDYRSKIEIDGPVRIVEVPGFDLCACCAPHVAATGEIGLIKILKCINYKGGIRLTIACGKRAFEALSGAFATETALGQLLSVKPFEITDRVNALQTEIFNLRTQIVGIQREAVEKKAALVKEGAPNAFFFEKDLDTDAQRDFVNLLKDKVSGCAGVFVGDDESGWKYIIGSNSVDSREVNNVLRASFDARGGGKPQMVQGSCTGTKEEILAALS